VAVNGRTSVRHVGGGGTGYPGASSESELIRERKANLMPYT
jgi:hypothetical protein